MTAYRVGPLMIRHTTQGADHVAELRFPTPEGDITITARAAGAALARLRPQRIEGDDPAEVAGFFDFVKRIGRSKVFRRVLDVASHVVSHPAFAAVASFVPGVGPGVAVAGQLAGHASRLLLDSTKGHPGAKRAIAKIRAKARAGDPEAKRAAAAIDGLKAANRAAAAQGPQAHGHFLAAVKQAAKKPNAAPRRLGRLPPLVDDVIETAEIAPGEYEPILPEEISSPPSLALGYAPPAPRSYARRRRFVDEEIGCCIAGTYDYPHARQYG